MAYLRFGRLRSRTLLRVHVSDDGLRALIDVDVLHADVLVTTVA
jgi:hypothetical protein